MMTGPQDKRALDTMAEIRARGWDRIIQEQVLQADEGCDLGVMRMDG